MSLPELIIKKSFNFSVWLISHFCDTTFCEQQHAALREMPAGTLGRDIADCLDANNIKLIPGFRSHDLKHVLLNFKMTPLDEIRMQAFMLGNGNYSLACFAILLFGTILLPNKWGMLYHDFLEGRKTIPVSAYTIEDYAEKDTMYLRTRIKANQTQPDNMKALTRSLAFGSIIAGIFGMCFCLPFLFSANMADIMGAGFPFIGGAILVMGGLLALSNMTSEKAIKQTI